MRVVEESNAQLFEVRINDLVRAGYVLTRLTSRSSSYFAIMELPTEPREFFKGGPA